MPPIFEIDNSESRIYDFLTSHSGDFSPPLDTRINIGQYAQKMATNGTNIFVCTDKDVGHACCYSNDQASKKAFLTSICIDSTFLGKSLGAELLSLVESKAREAGMEVLELEVSAQSERAQTFYRKHSYHLISTSPGSQSVLIMQKHINK